MSKTPQGWVETTIGSICNLVNGRAFKPSDWSDTGLPIVRIQNLNRPDAKFNRYSGQVDQRFLVEHGDLLFAWSGTPGTSFGAHIWSGPEAILNQHIFNVRFDQHAFDRTFLQHAINQTLDEQIAKAHGGVGLRHVTKGKFEETVIAVPPLPEQRRIVAKIDSLTAKSERARDHLDHIPRLVEKYKQAVLAAAFRGDLTREWRARSGRGADSGISVDEARRERDAMRQQRGLRTKGRNRSVPTKIANLIDLPRGWAWATFDECSWDMTVGHVGPMKDRYVADGITFLRSLNIRANRVDLNKVVYIDERFNDELAKSMLHPGDLVVVRTGEPGVAAVIPPELASANCSDLVIARLITRVNPHFAAYYMNSAYAKSVVGELQVGVAQQHFNVGAMSEMPLPLVPINEQAEIVRRIEAAFNWIDRLAADATSARRLIDRLDQSVLAKAFRGELVPQDPTDEPASALLERITAERMATPKSRRGRPRKDSAAQ